MSDPYLKTKQTKEEKSKASSDRLKQRYADEKKNKMVVRSTTHHFDKHITFCKQERINRFIKLYRSIAIELSDLIWNHQLIPSFNPKKGMFDLPSMIDSKYLRDQLNHFKITERLKQCIASQVSGSLRGAVEMQKKRLHIIKRLHKEGQVEYDAVW